MAEDRLLTLLRETIYRCELLIDELQSKGHKPDPNEGGSVGSNGLLVPASQAPTVASEPTVYNSPIGARTDFIDKSGGVLFYCPNDCETCQSPTCYYDDK